MAGKLLSKSKYMNGLQCPKLLWLICNEPEKVPEPDAAKQRIFDQGHLVGDLAKKLFPEGIDLPVEDFKGNLNRTRDLLAERKPLFEAGFWKESFFSRLDILNPVGRGQWDIIEVKSTTSVKKEHIQDVSFQRFCAEKAGLKINRCYLAFINNQYVRNGEIDPRELLSIQDITETVQEAAEGIQERAEEMLKTMAGKQCPEMMVGPHCSSPYDCPVTLCWDELPENSIFSLYRGGPKRFEMFRDGILNIRDIPEDYKLSAAQKIQQWCEINGRPHIEGESIRNFLKGIKSPVYYLDFETINSAVPFFNGIRPYQKIPFQFSLHIVDGEKLQHYSFLAEGSDDPRPAFLKRLKETLGTSGSIITYNQSFEEGVLKELAEYFPEYEGWVEGVRKRLADLLKPFQNFQYYHPEQHGSASIKKVLPALTGKGYEGMEIADGETASQAFLAATYGEATAEERQKIRANLEKYCGLDTEAMVRIMQKLKEAS